MDQAERVAIAHAIEALQEADKPLERAVRALDPTNRLGWLAETRQRRHQLRAIRSAMIEELRS